MGVLAVDLLLESFGRALVGLDAIDTLAEISPTTTAVILADRKPQQHTAHPDALMPDAAVHLVLLAQV